MTGLRIQIKKTLDKSSEVRANHFVLSAQEGKDYIPLESFPHGNAGCTANSKENLLAVTNMR